MITSKQGACQSVGGGGSGKVKYDRRYISEIQDFYFIKTVIDSSEVNIVTKYLLHRLMSTIQLNMKLTWLIHSNRNFTTHHKHSFKFIIRLCVLH